MNHILNRKYYCMVTILIHIFVSYCVLPINLVYSKHISTDDYVSTTQSECFTSKRIFSCVKYKAARFIWSFANGRMNLFEYENVQRSMRPTTTTTATSKNNEKYKKTNTFSIVKLSERINNVRDEQVFPKQITGENEFNKLWKFLQRSFNTFIFGHGIRMSLEKESGVNVIEDNLTDFTGDARGKKKKKWHIIFPIAILIKLMHIKLMLKIALLAIGFLQILTIGGGVLLFHYLKNNTLCKINPHLIQTHSHVTSDSEHDLGYSAYNGYVGTGGVSSSYVPTHGGGYNKDWTNKRTYNNHAYNILDELN